MGTFQFPSLLPSLTVLENVSLPTVFSPNGAKPGTHDRARGLLWSAGLADRIAAYPRQLSPGQQQRVVIARVLFYEPQALLVDEPTSDLDEQTEREIMDLFAKIHTQTGVTIVLVTHTTHWSVTVRVLCAWLKARSFLPRILWASTICSSDVIPGMHP